jgi:thiosulfate/3-mercaptopyruvate sulfurtransferase
MRSLALIFLLLLSACQNVPTKIYGTSPTQKKSGEQIPPNVIVIDARPAFEYSISHIPGSLHMRWEEFAQREEPFQGLLEQDLYFHARRLARYGIHPQSEILVVGRGEKGEGEEGRLAWTFKILGIDKVSFATIDNFSVPLTREELPPPKHVAIWKPKIQEALVVDRKAFLRQAMKPKTEPHRALIIDVRTEAQYLGKDTKSYYSKNAPDFGAMNIPWFEFFETSGMARKSMIERLQAVGIHADDLIYVIDEKGARSAAVTLALHELGYHRAANFAGGYMELIGRP